MRWAEPNWLWVLPPLLLWGVGWGICLVRNHHRRQRAFLATERVSLRVPRGALIARLASHVLVILALLCVVLALARPQGARAPSSSARHGVNLAIVLDGSRSMLCEDVLPSRLSLAQQALEALATEAAGSRYSLFMFGGTSTLLIPQTFDTSAVILAARSVTPDTIGKGGTALGPAIMRAADYLQRAQRARQLLNTVLPSKTSQNTERPTPQMIVVLSDGEDGEGDPLLSAMQAQVRGIEVHTITVGTKTGGPMPLYARSAWGSAPERAGMYPGGDQPPIITHADPELMIKLADAGGGAALTLTGGDVVDQVKRMVRQAILPKAVALEDVSAEEAREGFWVPLLLAVAILLVEQALRRWMAYRFAVKPPVRLRTAVLAPASIAVAVFLFALSPVHASPEKAESLLRSRHPQEALAVLRADWVRHPDNSTARYNYALGAYAAGIYTAAIEALTPLATVSDPALSVPSQFQLGNASFRLGEQMLPENPAGAALRFEDAVKRFDYSAQQSGDYRALARSNVTLAHEKASEAYLQVARAKVAEGDQAARIQPAEGFPAWEASLEYFDKAHEHRPAVAAIMEEKKAVVDNLARELKGAADGLVQQAGQQAAYTPERAIELYHQALDYYARSAKYGQDVGAQSIEARADLAHTLLAYVAKQHEVAESALPAAAQTALEALGKAQPSLEEAETLKVNPDAVTRERVALNKLWHRAYVQRGDDQVVEAAQQAARGDSVEQQRALLAALVNYQSALTYEPKDSATAVKRAALLRQLSALYTQQGMELLRLAKEKADSKIEEALASAEKSVQSFERALIYDPQNASAAATLPEARRVLQTLREKQKKDQKKSVEKSREQFKDSKDLKDLPKDSALKLLDYRNDTPAKKNPQLFTAPENKPVQDW